MGTGAPTRAPAPDDLASSPNVLGSTLFHVMCPFWLLNPEGFCSISPGEQAPEVSILSTHRRAILDFSSLFHPQPFNPL